MELNHNKVLEQFYSLDGAEQQKMLLQLIKNNIRYTWLRDRPHRSRYGASMESPVVMNRKKSVIYAVAIYENTELDRDIDEDILNDEIEFLHQTEYFGKQWDESGTTVISEWPSDDYAKFLFREAIKSLGYPSGYLYNVE